MRVRRVVAIRGIVQGVGFRPFVHRLAAAHGLAGAVRNFGAGVEVDVEGETASLDAFVAAIKAPPPPARVKRLDIRKAEPTGRSGFRIEASAASPDTSIAVGADRATCEACLAEMADTANRRWRHPFITCTECGPRLTVVADLPFDRARTTMAGFPMCAACRAEYEDPGDRRFHAQTLACPACGPRLRFGGAAEPIAAAADALADDLDPK